MCVCVEGQDRASQSHSLSQSGSYSGRRSRDSIAFNQLRGLLREPLLKGLFIGRTPKGSYPSQGSFLKRNLPHDPCQNLLRTKRRFRTPTPTPPPKFTKSIFCVLSSGGADLLNLGVFVRFSYHFLGATDVKAKLVNFQAWGVGVRN